MLVCTQPQLVCLLDCICCPSLAIVTEVCRRIILEEQSDAASSRIYYARTQLDSDLSCIGQCIKGKSVLTFYQKLICTQTQCCSFVKYVVLLLLGSKALILHSAKYNAMVIKSHEARGLNIGRHIIKWVMKLTLLNCLRLF